jgi:hypothetical protein
MIKRNIRKNKDAMTGIKIALAVIFVIFIVVMVALVAIAYPYLTDKYSQKDEDRDGDGDEDPIIGYLVINVGYHFYNPYIGASNKEITSISCVLDTTEVTMNFLDALSKGLTIERGPYVIKITVTLSASEHPSVYSDKVQFDEGTGEGDTDDGVKGFTSGGIRYHGSYSVEAKLCWADGGAIIDTKTQTFVI